MPLTTAKQESVEPEVETKEKPGADTTAGKDDAGGDTSETEAQEAEARAEGWRPKAEFKGAADKWVDAEEFIRRGKEYASVAKSRERESKRELAEMHKLLTDVLANQGAEVEKRVKRELAALQTKKRAAVAEGDVAAVEAIDTEIEETKAAAVPAPKAVKPGTHFDPEPLPPEYTQWGEQNSWFKNDRRMRAVALEAYAELEENEATRVLPATEKLKRTTAEVRKTFPDKFANPRRQEAPAVEGGNGGARPRAAGHTFADLPSEAKDICDRLVRTKVLPNREAYLKTYPW